MTAGAQRVSTKSSGGPHELRGQQGPGQSQGQDVRWVWFASEVLLVATSVATVFMLQRIFTDASFAAPLIFTLVVGHGVLISMRWFGFGTVTSLLVSLVATIAAIVAIHYSASALAAVIPTSSTIDQLRFDMSQAQVLFDTTRAPVPPVTGFLVISSVGLWFIGVAADWAAFRLFAPGQALIPFLSMLVFVSLLGTDEGRLGTTATALVCGVLFLLSHRAASRAAHGVWLDRGSGPGLYIAHDSGWNRRRDRCTLLAFSGVPRFPAPTTRRWSSWVTNLVRRTSRSKSSRRWCKFSLD